VQTDENAAPVVAGDNAAVRLVDGSQVVGPGPDAIPGRDAQGDQVEAGKRCCPLGVMP